jgi:hypothetical protein
MKCEKCQNECERVEAKVRKGMILKRNYYYAYKFTCRACKLWFYPEEAKTYYEKVDTEAFVSSNLVNVLKTIHNIHRRKNKKAQNELIERFHKWYTDNPNAFYNRREKLEALKYLSTVVYKRKMSNPKARGIWNKKKDRESFKPHVDARKCFICLERSQIRHHMIQLQHGGTNSYRNITTLCHRCHADIHPWLRKETEVDLVALALMP